MACMSVGNVPAARLTVTWHGSMTNWVAGIVRATVMLLVVWHDYAPPVAGAEAVCCPWVFAWPGRSVPMPCLSPFATSQTFTG
jgi:hypothetical protein